MDYIYTRVSTDKQTTENQELALQSKYPNAIIVSETASGAKHRPLLESLIASLEPGDRLIVAALDRLGRKTLEILQLIESLAQRKIILISDREGLDYSTPMGKLVTQILVSVAELEKSLISERTKQALKKVKAEGKILGAKHGNQNRKGKFTILSKEEKARFEKLSKVLAPYDLAEEMGWSLSKTYVYLRKFAA